MSANFQATAGELSLVTRIFAQADPNKTGFLSGDVAVRVFGGAKLPPTVLGEIWNIADDENRGSLNSKGVAVALRLIGWAQKGEKVTPALVNQAGPLPIIEGVSGISTHNTGMSIPRSPPPLSGLPPFTAQDKAKFQNMFLKSGPTNGLLNGEKARDILIKSKLSNEKLGQIWNLADTHDRGSLDATDFAIAMYLVQGAMSGQITTIPSVLPPALYQQASGSPAVQSAVRAQTTGTSGSFSPINSTFSQRTVQSQYTGQNQLPLQADVTGGFPARRGPPVPPHLPARPSPSQVGSGAFGRASVNTHWDITPAEKTDSDKFFDNLDSQRRGYIEGDVAVPFMLESQLGEEDLARVWDLADINNDGRLTRDGFAVALYLIKKKLAGVDVPATLPPTLVPPSMRKPNGSAFAPAPSPPPPAAPEPAIDLLWDDAPAQPVPAAAPSRAFSIPLQPTGSQVSPPASSFNSPPQPKPAAQDPFRSSPFGSGSGSAAAKDLLSDDDDVQAAPPRLHDQSAEIGNTQNQLNSTNRSLETTKTKRASVEQTLANQAAQLSALQTQLSSAKAAYETETKLLSTLRDRLNAQTAEIQKTRETLISSESDLSAVRVEKAEIEGAFLRDKEEARELHRKMLEFSQQADALKVETEKVKKEAKQQKGLLAIAKKQLSTKEADRAKAEKELQEANAELVAVNKEKAETEMKIAELDATPIVAPAPERALSSDSVAFAASHALPATPDPTSPAVSTKSNNPFDRLAMSSGHSTPRSESPFMPFAATSLPSPPTTTSANVTESGDPFGFSQAFESLDVSPEPAALEATKAPIEEPEVSTPKPPAAELGMSTAQLPSEAPTSPGSASETEVFSTPPTTSAGLPESANGKQSTLEDVPSKFPLIEEPVTVSPAPESEVPTEPPRKSEDHTDLGAPLKEIEVEESDSDSEEDEVPLALLAKRLSESPPVIAAPPPAETNGPSTAPASSFDDIFGVGSSPSPATAATSTGEADAFGVPIKKSPSPFDTSDVFTSSPTEKPQNGRVVSGVNVFDEAMGKLPSTGPSPTSFSFDSAFEDNFDFGASTEPAFPPAPKAVNGGATSPLPAPTKDDGFNSLFTTPTIVTTNGSHTSAPASDRVPTPTPAAASTTTSPTSTTEPSGPSFDDVFSGFNPSPSLNLDTTLTATPVKVTESPKPLPASASPPSSLQGGRPISPPIRERSPPPRVSSPKPRPSTSSSSKEGHELRPPPPRHSKLSIRLPFGKKKKQEAVAPPPSQFLTPPAEELRSTTPASDDDVEPVKQLTAMGFSRTQAVAALEKYGYDVSRALNSLLGQ
ncbi:uncharacterized protein EV420DRAFT_856567 [Desarmillaria tabescens]|uniref:Uncharacterized protein n=1 Tax=Armillaria tabescens TaxID=1929756 RepID=A0AA39JT73_ARMTA|nr:uncharacterized protein EV420DRAFT_856567 [Desarmillaria tabescens]KAK0448373.1 hypothetical protein EV420DRAFT_856567 [Desarmillaria tabescens]